jgi:hypothetical protein
MLCEVQDVAHHSDSADALAHPTPATANSSSMVHRWDLPDSAMSRWASLQVDDGNSAADTIL